MPERILLVDKSPQDLQLLWLALSRSGMALDAATTAADGLFLARRTEYAAVLFGSDWPLEPGLEFCRNLRGTLHGRPTPVIAVSAHALREDVLQAQRAGCDYYLTKPLALGRLGDLVRDMIRAA
jgi:DNA-binding response OmpR family regulator